MQIISNYQHIKKFLGQKKEQKQNEAFLGILPKNFGLIFCL
ncbi:Uncharacterized protein dnm_053910 [Desulfonema magnum]|uniref:Uncharacterized protein n=1 Tax=Desulfonema magnum TaxID=45655 RepID=A0A975BPK0_9BACT|nr:Uncharacterized protein dnm_053910 [Desulfonema magnum]